MSLYPYSHDQVKLIFEEGVKEYKVDLYEFVSTSS